MKRIFVGLFLALCLGVGALNTSGCGNRAEAIASEDKGEIVIRRTESGNPRFIDPHVSGDVVSSRHCGMTYECLFQYDYLKRPATLVPCLASKEAEYDAKTLTYTFHVRKDVVFQKDRCFHPDAQGKTFEEEGSSKQEDKADGRKLTAKDFIYSLKRLAALDSGGFWVIEGQIKGLDKFREDALAKSGEGNVNDPDKPWRDHIRNADVSGLKLIDDYTFSVTLNQPYPQFLYALTLSYGAAVAWEAVEYYREDLFRHPVGTGPFVLERWRPNMEIIWVRNPDFRDERFPTSDAPEDQIYKDLMGKKLPIADRVDFRIIKETQAAWLSFRKGLLDISGIGKDQFDMAIQQSELTQELKDQGVKLQKSPEPTIHYISFNMRDSVVGASAGEKGKALRKAFSLCIDREAYIDRYLNGRGVPARQIVPPGVNGHFKSNTMDSQQHDPEKGRKVLTDAGFILSGSGDDWVCKDPDTKKQVTIELLFRSTSDTTKQVSKFMQGECKKVGIKLNTELMTFPEFLRRQDEGKGQAYDAGWVMDYPDAQNMLQLLYGPNKPPGINSAAYDNKKYNELYDEMKVLSDANPSELDTKMEKINMMHKQLEEDTPWALMEFRVAYKLYHQWHLPPKAGNAFAYTYIKFEWSDSTVRAEKAKEWSERNYFWAFLIGLVFLVPAGMMGFKIYKDR